MLFSFWTSKNPGKALEKTVKQPWKTLDFLNFWRRTNPVYTLDFCFSPNLSINKIFVSDCFIALNFAAAGEGQTKEKI